MNKETELTTNRLKYDSARQDTYRYDNMLEEVQPDEEQDDEHEEEVRLQRQDNSTTNIVIVGQRPGENTFGERLDTQQSESSH